MAGGEKDNVCTQSGTDRPLTSQRQHGLEGEIRRGLDICLSKQQEKEQQEQVAEEWRMLALVLERVFFLFYVITIIVSLAAICVVAGQ